jgi:hypothetical protein
MISCRMVCACVVRDACKMPRGCKCVAGVRTHGARAELSIWNKWLAAEGLLPEHHMLNATAAAVPPLLVLRDCSLSVLYVYDLAQPSCAGLAMVVAPMR